MDYVEIINLLIPVIITALGGVLTLLGTELAIRVKKYLDTKEKREIAEMIAGYVGQTGKALTNTEKFNLAKKTLIEKLNKEGLKFTELELTMLIEAAVHGFKTEYAKVIEEEIKAIAQEPILAPVETEIFVEEAE